MVQSGDFGGEPENLVVKGEPDPFGQGCLNGRAQIVDGPPCNDRAEQTGHTNGGATRVAGHHGVGDEFQPETEQRIGEGDYRPGQAGQKMPRGGAKSRTDEQPELPPSHRTPPSANRAACSRNMSAYRPLAASNES